MSKHLNCGVCAFVAFRVAEDTIGAYLETNE